MEAKTLYLIAFLLWCAFHCLWVVTGSKEIFKKLYLFKDRWYISLLLYAFDLLGLFALIGFLIL